MSLSNITNPITGVQHDIYCDQLTCNNMVVPSITTPTITVDNITVNESYTSNAVTPATVTSFNQTLLLSDGSTTQISQSDNLLGTGVKGSSISRTSVANPNKTSSLSAVNAIAAGGPESVCNMIVRDTTIPGDLAMVTCLHDTTNFGILSLCNQGPNQCGMAMGSGNTSLSGNQSIDIQCTANDRIQLNSTSGLTDIKGNVGVILTSPFAQITALSNPMIGNIVTSDNIGQLSRVRYDQAYYGPAITNINRITGSTGFNSPFTTIGEFCYVNCACQVTVGAGAGSPSFFLSLPVSHSPFTTDVIFGTGFASDAGLTSTLPLDIATQTPAGTDALITITAGVAGIYNCKFSFCYPVV